jgi:hypothetical protein
MTVEIRKRPNKKYPAEIYDEVFIDNEPVSMGEGVASLVDVICKKHGKTTGIYGYNQGGYDGMSICLKCCKEIINHIRIAENHTYQLSKETPCQKEVSHE